MAGGALPADETISGRANLLVTYEVFHGDYRKLFSQPEDIEKVTPADIQRVAKNLFREENRTTRILDAQPGCAAGNAMISAVIRVAGLPADWAFVVWPDERAASRLWSRHCRTG